jgi:hypothetical protein
MYEIRDESGRLKRVSVAPDSAPPVVTDDVLRGTSV